VFLQLALVYLPFLQVIFKTTALSMRDLALALATSLTIFLAVEWEKWMRRHASSEEV
jgi:Ca2+-transporting ATPase